MYLSISISAANGEKGYMSSFLYTGWIAATRLYFIDSQCLAALAEVGRWRKIIANACSIHRPAFCLRTIFANLGGVNYG
jgi:ABC-type transporter Mla MlaB component